MGRVIGDLTPGTLVYLEETVSEVTSYVPYIWLGNDENNKGILLRDRAAQAKRMHSSNNAHYDGCEADLYLENRETGFLSRFNTDTLSAFDITSIKYSDIDTDTGDMVIKEIARTCFLLSYTECGYGSVTAGAEGISYLEALKTRKNTTNANTARVAINQSDSAVNWWLRSADSSTCFRIVNNIGGIYSFIASVTDCWLRPAVVIKNDTPVSEEGEETIYLFPTPGVNYRELGITIDLGSREKKPNGMLVSVATSNLTTFTCEVTTNFNDATPIWIQGNLDETIDVSSIIPSEGYELGVRFYGRSGGRGYIGEPIVLCK